MAKPILDALTGLIYVDDRQASDVHIISVSMSEVDEAERLLFAASQRILAGDGFVRVRIDLLS
jgi:hypothetical protein